MTRDRGRGDKAPSLRYWLLLSAALVACVVALAILIDSAAYYNKVHTGISVSGVALGGKTRSEAITAVAKVAVESSGNSVTLTAGDKNWTVLPTQVDAKMDVQAVVNAAMSITREGDFFSDIGTRWRLFFSDQEIPLIGTVDGAKLEAVVADIAGEIDIPSVNAGLVVENGVVNFVQSAPGKVVDQESLVKRLEERVAGGACHRQAARRHGGGQRRGQADGRDNDQRGRHSGRR